MVSNSSFSLKVVSRYGTPNHRVWHHGPPFTDNLFCRAVSISQNLHQYLKLAWGLPCGYVPFYSAWLEASVSFLMVQEEPIVPSLGILNCLLFFFFNFFQNQKTLLFYNFYRKSLQIRRYGQSQRLELCKLIMGSQMVSILPSRNKCLSPPCVNFLFPPRPLVL